MDSKEFERLLRQGQEKLPPEMRLSDEDIANAVRVAEGVDMVIGFFVKRNKPRNPLEDLLGRFDADKLITEVFSKTDFVRNVKKSVWDQVQEPSAETLPHKSCDKTAAHDGHGWWTDIRKMELNEPADAWCEGVTKLEEQASEDMGEPVVDMTDKLQTPEERLLKAIFEGVVPPPLTASQARLSVTDLDATPRRVLVTWARDNQYSVLDNSVTCETCWALISPTAHGMVEHRKVCRVAD